MDEIYLVDAVNYLFRSYYAIGPMTNEAGESTSALFGWIRSLQKLEKEFSPKHLVAVFDGPDNTKARKQVYSEYKLHRKKAPEDLYPQIKWAYQYCQLAGIPALSIEGVEADDTMASIALWAKNQNLKVFLCTSDKDLCQLVDETTFVLNTHKNNLLLDTNQVIKTFGVYPQQMLDFLAIVGDTSDNIPGIPGFGPKTAIQLLQQYGSLDNLLKHIPELSGRKKEILQTHQKQALLSKNLATLNTQVLIPGKASFYQRKPADLESLKAFYQKMGFFSLLKDLKPSPVEETSFYLLIDSLEGLKKLCFHFSQEKEIAIDTETTSLHPLEAELVGIGLCARPTKAAYIPCNSNLSLEQILGFLKKLFQDPSISWIGHNLKYDLHILKNEGIQLATVGFDTILASYLLAPQSRKHNLDLLALEHFHKQKVPIEDLIGKGKHPITLKEVPVEKVCTYCCEDVDYTLRLKQKFAPELQEKHLFSLLLEIELPLISVLVSMERKGIYLNQGKLSFFGGVLEKKIQQVQAQIYEKVGTEFNLNSPKQLSEVLFQKLKLSPPPHKKTEYSTGAKVLEMLAEENEVASQILIYRSLEKLRSTYVSTLIKQINPKTQRIHPNFNQSVAATGRLACQDPNLQNIPIRTEEGRKIRECFEPKQPGWFYLSADYSQIELRLLAHFSEDPSLLKAFHQEEDIHAYTASLIFHVPISLVTPEMRYQAKAVNFGILYGQSAFGLSQELKIPVKEAAHFIEQYFSRYPSVSTYMERCKEQVRRSSLAYTLTGRQRPIPEIHSKNPHLRAAAERLAVNTPLQGSAADIIKKAMIAIHQEILLQKLQGFMVLQIHDELIFEIPEGEIPIFKQLVKEKMEKVFPLKVPLSVDLSLGKNWGEC